MSLHKVDIFEADITTLKVDAIINAANSALLGEDGVDGAIHRAAAEELYRECFGLNGCMTGEAKITAGYRLPAKPVIHAVGPFWKSDGEREALAFCHINAMRPANDYRLRSIAFPSFSTGIYRFPIKNACEIAFDTVLDALNDLARIEQLIFCTFSAGDFSIYQRELTLRKELAGQN